MIEFLGICFFIVVVFCACGTDKGRQGVFSYNALIGKGLNLGNALEAPKEGAWGVTLRKEYFSVIKKAGFTSVRIPIKWSAHAAEEPPYAIKKEFFSRVDRAVNEALAQGLAAIIDVHHYQELMESPEVHKERFLELWRQIAGHYKDYPELLYFEVLNEPSLNLTGALWNSYLAEAIDIIRQSNPGRIIIAGPANFNNIYELKNLRLPEDDKNIIVTFHYYEPFEFTHQGAEWVEGSAGWLGRQWNGTLREKQLVCTALNEAVKRARAGGRPLFMGEFGAYGKADMSSRNRWTAFVRKEAEKRGISWAYWEFCSGFGVYEQDKKEWKKPLLDALLYAGE